MRIEDSEGPLPPEETGAQEGLDRRTVLKTGALIGAAAVLTSKKSLVLAQSAPPPPAEPALCGTTPPVSPPTTPFMDTLPVPFPAIPQFLNPVPTKAANIRRRRGRASAASALGAVPAVPLVSDGSQAVAAQVPLPAAALVPLDVQRQVPGAHAAQLLRRAGRSCG